MERIGLGISGLAIIVAVVALVVGASPVTMLAVLVGLGALWPAVHARN